MEIKKCPYCGSTASLLKETTGYYNQVYYKVFCDNNHCVTNHVCKTSTEAITLWNGRVDES